MTLQKYIISFREGMNIYEQGSFEEMGVICFMKKIKQLIKIKTMIL